MADIPLDRLADALGRIAARTEHAPVPHGAEPCADCERCALLAAQFELKRSALCIAAQIEADLANHLDVIGQKLQDKKVLAAAAALRGFDDVLQELNRQEREVKRLTAIEGRLEAARRARPYSITLNQIATGAPHV